MQRTLGNQTIHVSYCTNVHPGETWAATFANLEKHTLAVKRAVSPDAPFGIGLRIGNAASIELSQEATLEKFKKWLGENGLYVFTINGFPYGQFHGGRVKEEVFRPDWTREDRLKYTVRLGHILAELLPREDAYSQPEGSISTLPGTFKEFVAGGKDIDAICENLAECAWEFEEISNIRNVNLHLGLEPEPLGLMETTADTVKFYLEHLRPKGTQALCVRYDLKKKEALELLNRRIGICYDTCHMAVEYESAEAGIKALASNGIMISKVQVSSALKLHPGAEALTQLGRFADGVYLHQVLARQAGGAIKRWKDIAPALAERDALLASQELRVHCHVPLYMTRHGAIDSTSDFIPEVLAALVAGKNPVAHFELETYTWDVLPEELRDGGIDAALAKEIEWFLGRLAPLEKSST